MTLSTANFREPPLKIILHSIKSHSFASAGEGDWLIRSMDRGILNFEHGLVTPQSGIHGGSNRFIIFRKRFFYVLSFRF